MEKDFKKLQKKKLYSRNFTKYGLDMNLVVSIVSGLFILIFSFYALLNLEHALKVFENIKDIILAKGD